MKEQDNKLTLQETDKLCSLYMDCNLSVFEETELRYFLSHVDYHSPLIDEVRKIMDIETNISDKSFEKTGFNRKQKFRKLPVYVSIAACVAIVIGVGLPFLQSASHSSVESQSFYIAYVEGHRLSDEEARLQIEAEKKAADEFIKEMSELEANKLKIMDNFYNP